MDIEEYKACNIKIINLLKSEVERISKKHNITKDRTLNLLIEHNIIPQREYTLQEIGDILGLTRERVRQIEKVSISKLKSPRIMKREIRDNMNDIVDYLTEHEGMDF